MATASSQVGDAEVGADSFDLGAADQQTDPIDAGRNPAAALPGRGRTKLAASNRTVADLAEQWLKDRRALAERRLDRLGALGSHCLSSPVAAGAASSTRQTPPASSGRSPTPSSKRRWFAEGEDWRVEEFIADFRPAGRPRDQPLPICRWSADHPPHPLPGHHRPTPRVLLPDDDRRPPKLGIASERRPVLQGLGAPMGGAAELDPPATLLPRQPSTSARAARPAQTTTPPQYYLPPRQRRHRESSGPSQDGRRRPRHPDRRRSRPHPAIPQRRTGNDFTISIAPVVLGNGTRLFDCIEFGQVDLNVIDTIPSPQVTHLRYAVNPA